LPSCSPIFRLKQCHSDQTLSAEFQHASVFCGVGDHIVEDRMDRNGEQVARQSHHPSDRCQKAEPGNHRKTQTDETTLLALLRWQAIHENGDEDDIVDAQNDLKERQGEEGGSGIGLREPGKIEHGDEWKVISRIAA